MGSYYNIVDDVIQLLKQKAIAEAKERVRSALKEQNTVDYASRAKEITVINQNIAKLKKQIRELEQVLALFPENERLLIEVEVQDMINGLCKKELIRLRRDKSNLSLPN